MKSVSERLHAAELFRHFIEAVDDSVEGFVSSEAALRLNAHRKIALHDLLGSVRDALHGTLDRDLAANAVDHGKNETEECHVQEGQLRGGADVFVRQDDTEIIRQQSDKQHRTAGDDEGYKQKEHKIMIQPFQNRSYSALCFHFITAL